MGAEKTDREAMERAYGALWLVVSSDARVIAARKLLLGQIDKDGQKRGIDWAIKTFGAVAEEEIR